MSPPRRAALCQACLREGPTSDHHRMFVRGLQASYMQYAPKLGIHIPHGDVLLFGLCCGQIMWAWFLAPETIPRDYRAW